MRIRRSVEYTTAHSGHPPPHSHSPVADGKALANVQATINDRRNGTDFRPQLLLHPSKCMPIIVCYQVDSETQVTKPAGATNPVKVGFTVFWEVKIDNNIH
jgi:hypothetical protein